MLVWRSEPLYFMSEIYFNVSELMQPQVFLLALGKAVTISPHCAEHVHIHFWISLCSVPKASHPPLVWKLPLCLLKFSISADEFLSQKQCCWKFPSYLQTAGREGHSICGWKLCSSSGMKNWHLVLWVFSSIWEMMLIPLNSNGQI